MAGDADRRASGKDTLTERVASGTVFCLHDFAGVGGKDPLNYTRKDRRRLFGGGALNTAMTYGYDIVTMMRNQDHLVPGHEGLIDTVFREELNHG